MTDALKTAGIAREQIEKTLLLNHTWTLLPPVSADVIPSEAAKAWTAEKAITLNIITKSMRVCEEQNGHDYMIDVWAVVQRQLADPYSANWHRPCGTKAIWWAMYKKASLKVQQNRPKQVGSALPRSFADEMREMVKKSWRDS